MKPPVRLDDHVYADAESQNEESRQLPTFEVPSGAPLIPASHVQRVLDEEGYF